MRHRIAVLGSTECARAIALLLVARDDCELLLTGEDGAPFAAAAEALGTEPRVRGPVHVTELTAATFVVVCDRSAAPVRELGRRCPDARLILSTPDPIDDGEALQAELLWPRQRVVGVDTTAATGGVPHRAAAAVRLIDFIIGDRGRTVEATFQTTAEGGPGSWRSVPVRLGAAGVQAVLAPSPGVTAPAAP